MYVRTHVTNPHRSVRKVGLDLTRRLDRRGPAQLTRYLPRTINSFKSILEYGVAVDATYLEARKLTKDPGKYK